jgi:hypothetical protein
LKKDPAAYLESIEGDFDRCCCLSLDFEKYGYRQVNEEGFETGFHEHQDADPQKIAEAFDAAGVKRYIFTLDSASQFDSTFSVWVHKSQSKKARKLLKDGLDYHGYSPAEAMKKGLAATHDLPPQPAGTTRITTVQHDGSLKVRDLTPHEFIEGKLLT